MFADTHVCQCYHSKESSTHSENPFHFSRNSTFPFTSRRSKTFSTTYSSSSSSSAAAAAPAAAGTGGGGGGGGDAAAVAGCCSSSSSAFLPFFPAMVASLTFAWTAADEMQR